ncbi:indolepyruvate ferredoxin oxidoreductase subunit alpha [Harryflintia acetispora]|uniref:indolepyruvate ferredoxin oxidoreductase subunit alpha n=1 Tax=Harryflintia acetispora TaxID=1849041 RepID=UPI00189B9E26|nr:indolepyruvate ferredoxin oxidoreductase subunit alpha [Harryflintia acetispora]
MKQLMLGNKAVARGLYEAGCTIASSYPGTPSTEITEEAAKFEEIYAEWAPNEKVAMEAAIGASIGGARSFCAMKHVGLNVAADPLFTASYTGVNGGMLIAVADDPGMHSSQNEQDSRHYAEAAKLMMLEPSDSAECLQFTKDAFELSERFDLPVLLRLSTRISHSQSIVDTGERQDVPLREYKKNPQKYVMMPGNAKGRHVAVEERQRAIKAYAENCPYNRVEMGDRKLGIITGGVAYQYAKEAFPQASFLKLGISYPLPEQLLRDFAAEVETLYVVEELDPFIENHCRALGLEVKGKEEFTLLYEYSQTYLRERIAGEKPEYLTLDENIPVRPPVMCPGCPHRGLFYTLHKLGVTVFGDIGCYTLGAAPPLQAMDTTVCMGASISGLHGFNKARGSESAKNSVAVIGDSTFMHSGVTGLINITYNKGISTVIVLDNSITGMTGHQQNPTTGLTLKNEPTYMVSIEKMCEGAGVRRIRVVDPNELYELKKIITEELAADEPSVIITRRPCVLLKKVKKNPPFHVDRARCVSCKMCLGIGCPAISMKEGKAQIDATLCVGCDLCQRLCKPGAIKKHDED